MLGDARVRQGPPGLDSSVGSVSCTLGLFPSISQMGETGVLSVLMPLSWGWLGQLGL